MLCGKRLNVPANSIDPHQPAPFVLVEMFCCWSVFCKSEDRFTTGFYSLPLDEIVNKSKLNASADDKINVTQKLKFKLGKVENIVGKRENAGCQHFLLFPQCFQKAFYLESLRVVIVW